MDGGTGIRKISEISLTRDGLQDVSYGGYLNGESFQQDGILTFADHQYAVFYNTTRHVCIARRRLPESAWSVLEFTDYSAALPSDAHNTISAGICQSDGTIHLAFDHHGHPLHYRVSVPGLAFTTRQRDWTVSSFSPVTDMLGRTRVDNVTYPRFLSMPDGSLLFEYRYGTSGEGDQHLMRYSASGRGWTDMGKYIDGISSGCNAYPHGLSADRDGQLHLTWCWRETPDPSTNHDLLYVGSDDGGRTWKAQDGTTVGVTGSRFITPITETIRIVTIRQNRGLLNQEAHTVDTHGRVHVLLSHLPEDADDESDFTRARLDSAYFHYHMNAEGSWTGTPTGIPSIRNFRGKLLCDGMDTLFAVLPNLRIAAASKASEWTDWKVVYNADENRFFSDPLVDAAHLHPHGRFSVLCPVKASGDIRLLEFSVR